MKKIVLSMMFLGIDQSITQTGVVILNENGQLIHSEVISFSKYDRKNRIQKIYMYFCDLAKKYNKMQFALEDYSFGSKFAREKTGELRSLIELALIQNKINYQIVPIKSHRKATFGNGNIKKEDASLEATRLYGVRFRTLDEFDAFSIAYFLYLQNKNK